MPDWLPFSAITDSVAVAGIAVAGAARVGDVDGVLKAHLGESLINGRDAVIAATANSDADILVSDDRRCRERAKQFARCESLTYEQFVERLQSL